MVLDLHLHVVVLGMSLFNGISQWTRLFLVISRPESFLLLTFDLEFVEFLLLVLPSCAQRVKILKQLGLFLVNVTFLGSIEGFDCHVISFRQPFRLRSGATVSGTKLVPVKGDFVARVVEIPREGGNTIA